MILFRGRKFRAIPRKTSSILCLLPILCLISLLSPLKNLLINGFIHKAPGSSSTFFLSSLYQWNSKTKVHIHSFSSCRYESKSNNIARNHHQMYWNRNDLILNINRNRGKRIYMKSRQNSHDDDSNNSKNDNDNDNCKSKNTLREARSVSKPSLMKREGDSETGQTRKGNNKLNRKESLLISSSILFGLEFYAHNKNRAMGNEFSASASSNKNIFRPSLVSAAMEKKEDRRMFLNYKTSLNKAGTLIFEDTLVDKSPSDDKFYRPIQLKNGLRVLLISDPETQTSAAAMDVHTGHFNDPSTVPGLAHFCEHMLFLGTKKYPDEDDYSSFLASHGGNSNAYTDTEDTVYYFNIDSNYLQGGIDRFAQFFISPLFSQSATDRELNAIESENAKNLQSDGFRLYQLEKSRSSPNYPYSKFGTGNKKTLSIDTQNRGISVRDELLKFHDQYYKAEAMTLTIIGKESLDELQTLVEKTFAGVPAILSSSTAKSSKPKMNTSTSTSLPSSSTNKESPNTITNIPMVPMNSYSSDKKNEKEKIFPTDSLSKLYKVVPVKDLRQLVIVWPVVWDNAIESKLAKLVKPEFTLSNILGYEGDKSLTSLLKKKGYANNLSAGYGSQFDDISLYEVVVDLTSKGLENYEDVMSIIYSMINLLQSNAQSRASNYMPIGSYFIQDSNRLAELSWQFQEKGDPDNIASGLANEMQKFANQPEYYLSGSDRIIVPNKNDGMITNGEIDESEKIKVQNQLITKLINLLTPERALNTLISKSFENIADDAEFWYGTKFKAVNYEPLRRKLENISILSKSQLDLPPPNKYIPTDLSIKAPLITSNNNFKATRKKTKKINEAIEPPQIIREDTKWKVFYKLDKIFGKPRAYIVIQLRNPLILQSAANVAISKVYRNMLMESLSEYAYPALLAGLSYDVEFTARGPRITLGGYNDKMVDFADDIVQKILDFQPKDKSTFDRVLDTLLREYEGFTTQQPYNHASYFISLLQETPKFYLEDVSSYIKNKLSLKDVQQFAKDIWTQGFGTALIQGNLDENEAETIIRKVEATLQFELLPAEKRITKQIVQFPLTPTSQYGVVLRKKELNPENINSAVQAVYQVTDRDLQTRVLAELLSLLWEQPFYESLRTKQQLGYIVYSGIKSIDGVLNLAFVVQSSVANVDDISTRIQTFIDDFEKVLFSKLKENEFEFVKEGLINKKLEPDKRLDQEASRNWDEIILELYRYNRNLKEAEMLRKVKKTDVINFFQTYIKRYPAASGNGEENKSKRRLVTSQSISQNNVAVNENLKTVDELKASSMDTDSVIEKDEFEFKKNLVILPSLKEVL